MQVVAEASIEEIVEGDISTVWQQTKNVAGITHDFYCQYYAGKSKAVAYRLKDISVFDEPKLLEKYGVRCAPQSFVYVTA